MARPLRICIPGGVYHVIARGNERAPIYRDDADRFAFLRMLARVVDRFGWLCHAYCLMGTTTTSPSRPRARTCRPACSS